ncbi:MAG: Fic family protein [bacterium]
MTYSPSFTITSKLLRNVGSIDAAREVINHAPLIPAWERRFQSEARAKIIHHGTHLEGNALNLEEVEKVIDQKQVIAPDDSKITGRDRDIQEVINYRAVMEYLDDLKRKALASPLPLTEAMLSEIHRLTVNRLMPESEAGLYRTVKVVIRNTTTGEITFRPPPPTEVPSLISQLFTWLNLTSETPSRHNQSLHPLLRAGILHYELARIHPFTDGNGRTARAAALLLLYLEGYEVKRFFSLEEYYDAHPSDYYDALKSVELADGDLTTWLEYFCLGIAIEFNRVKELVQKLSLDLKLKTTLGGKQIALTDRQIRLVEYLERHGSLSMREGRDLLPDVSDDTVLRDLRDLCDKKLIKKKGNTKGAKYYLKSN